MTAALATQVLAAARAKGIKIATAESCTGGMVAAALTDIAGSSDVFDRGFITYSNAAKVSMLAVSPETLATYGAVSEAVAVEMAAGALHAAGVALTLSITGIAGPGGAEHKPEGRVCFGLAQQGQPSRCETVDFGPLGRRNVRYAATKHGLGLLALALR